MSGKYATPPATVFGRDSASHGTRRTVKLFGVRKFYMVIESICQALTEIMTRNKREGANPKLFNDRIGKNL
jgi:hypothetical protein